MNEPRDFQRSKVYRAEMIAFRGHKSGPHPQLAKVADVAEWITTISRQIRHLPGAETIHDIAIKDGRGRRSGAAFIDGITVPRFARTTTYILHELSHVAVSRALGHHTVPAHGVEFCRIYLQMIDEVMGDDAHGRLVAAFDSERVKYEWTQGELDAALRV